MKSLFKFFSATAACLTVLSLSSCNDDDDKSTNTWEDYKAWRQANTEYFEEAKFSIDEDGQPTYSTLVPVWNPGAEVLIKYFNDRRLTEGNLSPMLTSTISVKYRGQLHNGVAFDSSYLRPDSLYITRLQETVNGWWVALSDMRVGDSARVVIPYGLGYGGSATGIIPPYSTLIFDIKLVDIPYYEVRR